MLAIDMDAQGSLTSLLSHREDISAFRDRSVLNALLDLEATGDALFHDYVVPTGDRLDLLPAEDLLAILPRLIYTDPEVRSSIIRHDLSPAMLLQLLLSRLFEVRQYDYVIIDTPPHLGDATINAFAAAQSVVVPFEPSAFCLDALPVLKETIDVVRDSMHSDIRISGILCTLYDSRRSDAQMILAELRANPTFGPLVFQTIVRRKAAIGRMPLYGMETPELRAIVEEYSPYVEELIRRL